MILINLFKLRNSDQGIDGYEDVVPVTTIISAPGFPTKTFHFYDFDTTVKTSDLLKANNLIKIPIKARAQIFIIIHMPVSPRIASKRNGVYEPAIKR